MADWFAKLMQRGHAPQRPTVVRHDAPGDAAPPQEIDARDARFDSVVQRLRDREAEERDAREKRHRWYRQSVETETEATEESSSSVTRLYRLRTTVPCRATPAAQALLEHQRKRYAGCTVSFSQLPNRRQAVMLTGRAGAIRRQIGWVEHCVQTDPELCNVRNQGLSVDTDGDSMLVLRFNYPSTSVRMSREHPSHETRVRASESREAIELDLASGGSDEVKYQDFAEVCPALDLHPREKEPSPRLVWVTRPETETMNALQSREYEAFYLRFKLEVQAGIWSALLGLLSTLPGSQWHHGSCYTVVREAEASLRKIHQRTVDDCGHRIDIGQDRTFDAAPATDILLLHLEGDLLADFADIYFTLQSLSSADAYFLKEEFFTVIRRFWTTAQSLASPYGGDLPALMRMSQRAVPMPAQAPMLKQDWTTLRQCLIDRYGEGGRKAADLVRRGIHRLRARDLDWPFSAFPAGEINIGLRLIYRQSWRHIGAQRGEVIRSAPLGNKSAVPESDSITSPMTSRAAAEASRVVETTIEKGPRDRTLDQVVNDITKGMIDYMKWPTDFDGSIHIGRRDLAVKSEMEAEYRESSRNIGLRLTEIARSVASDIVDQTNGLANSIVSEDDSSSISSDPEKAGEQESATRVYSRLRNLYEVLTRPAEIQNVVLVAEKLPAPGEINRSWVSRHDWILAKVLLDESFRDALETIGVDSRERRDRFPRDVELDAKRDRLYEHFRANILHYQRAIWRQEDPQHRSMRYRKSGKKMPLEWQFELESGSELTIEEFGDRLAAANVDGHFASYSGGKEADLDRLIDPAGLLGYHGNYAVFRMRPELGTQDLFSMLHFFKSPYLQRNPETGQAVVDDPARIRMCDGIVTAPDDPELLFRRERSRTVALKSDGMVIDVVRSAPPTPRIENVEDVAVAEEVVRYELILEGASSLQLLKSNAQQSESESVIVLDDEESQERLLGAGGIIQGTHPSNADSGIFARGQRSAICAGNAYDSESSNGIVATSDAASTGSIVTGVGTREGERVIQARIDEGRCIGQPHDSRSPSGIINGNDRDSTLVPAVHREAAANEQVAVSLGDDDAGPTSFRVGRARAIVEQVILEPESGGLRLSSISGGGAARAHERVILAAGDAPSTPSLVAGAGASNEYEHMVLGQDDEWLRPSLVVG